MNENLNELFLSLLRAINNDDMREAYRTLRFALNRSVDLALHNSPLLFSGLFAKINHLLVHNGADRNFIQSMSGTRNRIRNINDIDDATLQRSILYDAKNITRFITIVFSDAEVPEELRSRLPKGTLKNGWTKAATNYLRIIVDSVDDNTITGTAAEGENITVRVDISDSNAYLQFDYSYLPPLLQKGTQLNIIRPRQQEDGLLLPELIILEPDFLVDISAISAAFKEYGTTPLTNLLNKLSAHGSTAATLLGDFAGQLLEEEVHGMSQRPYAESISDFCSKKAISMVTCPNLDGSFHEEAMRQKRNIHKAISHDLPESLPFYTPDDILLEPSFASEMLGIQGRMDFMQADGRILIEQKSGKAAFIPGQRGNDNPTLTVPHFVQLLLYRALLHYNHNMPNDQIRPLLLYSKYTNPLVHTESAPQLLHEAFRLRNQLVWMELHLSAVGFGVVETLTPEQLNKNHVSGTLWNNYTRPDIEAILQPIHDASPLERAYYLRMLQFVQRETILAKIGNQRKENSGMASRWHDSLEEKRQAGNIYDRLTLRIPDDDESISELEVMFSDDTLTETANFRVGDIVTLFSYQLGHEPDCRTTMVHRATIMNISTEGIRLRLRAPQTNRNVFTSPLYSLHSPHSTLHSTPNYAWAIEHDFLESMNKALFHGIHTFLSAPKERRDLILSQRHPHVDDTLTLRGDYGTFNDLSLRVRQAQELFLIIGPPGTGKTSFGMLNTLKEELLSPDASVAVMAYTNRAVDEICSKLVAEGIDFVRIGSEMSCGEEYRNHMLSNKVKSIKKISQIRDYIRLQRVIVGTSSAFNSNLSLFQLRTFSLAIIDEASQILEPHLLGILSAYSTTEGWGAKKIVMIGDHKQLPAVVQQTAEESYVDNPALRDIGLTNCRLSLFERMLRQYRDDPSVVYMLRHQGRMHEDISFFPNHEFYGGQLACVPLPHQTEASEAKRLQFIDVPLTDSHPRKGWGGVSNLAEAKVIADIVIREHTINHVPLNQIGIIVPYRNQIAAIRNSFPAFGGVGGDLTIDTVERFQGSQREVIIYGFTVQHPYQLDFLTENCFEEDGHIIDRKLNVVMTRAMKKLYLVGNATLLRRNPLFATLIDYAANPELSQE